MGGLRVVGVLVLSAVIWLVVASQVPGRERLHIGSIVPGAVVTQPFGCTTLALEPFDPFCPSRHVHTGIDLAASTGADVHSATDGTAGVGYDPNGAGLFVVVRVDARVRIFYCHLSRLLVRDGDVVTPGQVIGLVGSTGLATGPHVHLEIQVDRAAVDPAAWLAS